MTMFTSKRPRYFTKSTICKLTNIGYMKVLEYEKWIATEKYLSVQSKFDDMCIFSVESGVCCPNNRGEVFKP
jgi:hypothetical protein